MKLLRQWRSLIASACIIVIVFVLISFLDIGIAALYSRFYSPATFVATFGVGGIFAAAFGYFYGLRFSPTKDEWTRWTLIIAFIAIGLFLFFRLAKIEGGEYEPAFKAFGATLALGSLLFIGGTVNDK